MKFVILTMEKSDSKQDIAYIKIEKPIEEPIKETETIS